MNVKALVPLFWTVLYLMAACGISWLLDKDAWQSTWIVKRWIHTRPHTTSSSAFCGCIRFAPAVIRVPTGPEKSRISTWVLKTHDRITKCLNVLLKSKPLMKWFFCDVICASWETKICDWHGQYNIHRFLAVVYELADRKRDWNRSWFSGIYRAEKSWNLLLTFE